ncbi:MAG: hypothetical protein AAFU41_00755 [Pseudomonadota bacterium]
MNEEQPDDSWMDDPKQSLVPSVRDATRKKPARQKAKPNKKKPSKVQTTADAIAADAPAPPTEDDIRDAIENAPEAAAIDPPANKGDKPAGSGRPPPPPRTRPKGQIWDDCPVTPLGVCGDYSYWLDANNQMRHAKKLEAQVIQSLFGHQIPKLIYHFPQWTKGDPPQRAKNRFDQTHASITMHAAASECGVFNPENAVRGQGAWQGDEGELIYHQGDAVLVGGKRVKPGKVGPHIYPALPPVPPPHEGDTSTDPVPELLRVLETWNWTQPDTHPFIALGMIATQMLCGALDWRPVFWLLAPAGAGKSELQKLLRYLHGDTGLIQSTDVTKSGLTSQLGQSSLPVAVDELEPGDERSSKERDIITLARVAASGGRWFRGSADQTGVGGQVYSAFLFSSILIPGVMKTQDVQRLIRLELRPLDKGAKKPNMQPRTWRARGARIKRFLIDRWPTWSERLELWRAALERAGITGRDADNWGTVLAMADMAQNADLPDDAVTDAWAKKVAFLATADREDTNNDAEAMLLHLMSQPMDVHRRGELFTVAQWVMTAACLPSAPGALRSSSEDGAFLDKHAQQDNANTKLAKYGMRVIREGAEASLFLANSKLHGLLQLFQGSDWAGGVWQQSAARVPGAERGAPRSLAGIRTRGYEIPLRSVPGLLALPADKDKASLGGPSPDVSDVDDFA